MRQALRATPDSRPLAREVDLAGRTIITSGGSFAVLKQPTIRSMILRHVRLPGLTTYRTASKLQESLVRKFLTAKASSTTPPRPTILTAEFHPIYTAGRREIGTLSNDQINYLKDGGPLGKADFEYALRGGQTTFHGPGQLTSYPIIDLKTHGLTPRSYVCLLEKALIATCAHYGVGTTTTENTGVWLKRDDTVKIAALGVHMRRHITSHGVGLNVATDTRWFERIVACGLEGMSTGTINVERGQRGLTAVEVEEVGQLWVREIMKRLDGVSDIAMEIWDGRQGWDDVD